MLPATRAGINIQGELGTYAHPWGFNVSTSTTPHPYTLEANHPTTPITRSYSESLQHSSSSLLWAPLEVLVPKAMAGDTQPSLNSQPASELKTHEAKVDSSLAATWDRALHDPAVAGSLMIGAALGMYGVWRIRYIRNMPKHEPEPAQMYSEYRAQRDEIIGRLKGSTISPQEKIQLSIDLANLILQQSKSYLVDLKEASHSSDKVKGHQIIKVFSEDMGALTDLLDQWHVRNDEGFRKLCDEIEAKFFNAENNPFKRLSMFWYNNLNTFLVYCLYLVASTSFDAAAAPILHAIAPTLFSDQGVDWSAWDVKPFKDKLDALFKFNLPYNYLCYTGLAGMYSKNTNGPIARLNNAIIGGLALLAYPILRPTGSLFVGADRMLHSKLGEKWEAPSTFLWHFGRHGIFGATGYARRLLGKNAFWPMFFLETLIGSLGNVGNAETLAKPNLSFAERLIDASQHFWELINTKVLPALWMNVPRTIAFTYISQHPRNDAATGQAIRFSYGVPSGVGYLVAALNKNILEPAVNPVAQLLLGVGALEYGLATCSNWFREATSPRDAVNRFFNAAKATISGEMRKTEGETP